MKPDEERPGKHVEEPALLKTGGEGITEGTSEVRTPFVIDSYCE